VKQASFHFIDLFSGIGGIELGFERAGFKTIGFVENNPYCQEVLRKHWPQAAIYDDITKMDFGNAPRVDVLTGGFPCQPWSSAGKRKGPLDERWMWPYFAKAIRMLRPRIALIENVPILTKRGLNVVLADIAEMGYDAEWFTLSAQEVGAIHVRERIFIIAYSCEFRRLHLRFQIKPGKGEQQAQLEDAPSFITHDWSERIQRFKQESLQGKQGLSWCKDVRGIEDFKTRQDIPEPLFCGGRDGIPDWMDRIKACGNAVVPQCAEFIAEIIKEKEQPPTPAKTGDD